MMKAIRSPMNAQELSAWERGQEAVAERTFLGHFST